MAAVTIKGREEALQIKLSESSTFDIVMKELTAKLMTMQRLSQSNTWEAFFSIPSHYNEEQLYQIFHEVAANQGIISGFTRVIDEPSYVVYDKDIRSGEHIEFESTTIVFGNIHPDAFVSCTHDLFVMGQIEGSITLKQKQSALYAMSCIRANIQIFDEIRPDQTSFSPIRFYYGNSK